MRAGHRRVATLGGELTFAGQATLALLGHRPDLTGPDYFPTMDAVAEAVLAGSADLGVLTSETANTACTDTAARILAGDPLYVAAEIVVPYHCALLARPGTVLADIRHVGGHGSIRQCRRYLAEHLPAVTVEMHRQNSVVAARELLAGDGTSAIIGTEAVAGALGLEILARDVDEGSQGGWWALSAQLEIPDDADHLALRVEPEDLGRVLADIQAHGLVVRTITNAPTGRLFRYRYLITLRTADGSPVPGGVLDAFRSCLAGVFTHVEMT